VGGIPIELVLFLSFRRFVFLDEIDKREVIGAGWIKPRRK
jgi:hypothetical protein